MYVPSSQLHAAAARVTHGYFQVSWVVRADNTGPALAQQIAEEMRKLDPRQPFSAFRTMDDIKRAGMGAERFQMTLLGVFAAIGLLLAAAGVYGVMAYSVAQRTREFGIRMALGATRTRILRSVLWRGTVLALIGNTIGVTAALGLTKTLQGFVWGVSALDPFTFVAVGIVLMVVALAACFVPALRAVRLNPVTALRE
jgi:ABC-type antimicrobial peptide transport system permease subunit